MGTFVKPGTRIDRARVGVAAGPLLRRPPSKGFAARITTSWMWIERMFRELRYRVRAALTMPSFHDAPADAERQRQLDRERLAHEYSQGYMAGWHECFDTCLQAVEDEIASVDDVWRMGACLTGSGAIQRDN